MKNPRFIVGFVIALLSFGIFILRRPPATPQPQPQPQTPSPSSKGTMTLVFLDVGQGDAVLVQSPEGKTLLYDGGPKKGNLVAKLRKLGVTTLDLVISSHGDADHIAAQEDVILAFGAKAYMDNTLDKGTRTQERLLQAVKHANARLLEPTKRIIHLGSVELEIVPPPLNEQESTLNNSNANSIGVAIRFGSFRVWLSGDSEEPETRFWLRKYGKNGPWANVDVYKSIHHGSSNGDTEAWLRAVRPKLAIISVGKNNKFGHPSPRVLALYKKLNIPYYRTDISGDIKIFVPFNKQFSITIQNGNTSREK